MSGRSTADDLARQFEIQKGMAHLFELAMQDGRTPPLAALECLARALGGIYRDIARVHSDPAGCSCGWTPAEGDLKALSEAMRSTARPAPRPLPNLKVMEPAGRA